MPSSVLAQELIDAIVGQVPSKYLISCSMVARSFLVPSQRRLFASLSRFTDCLDIPGPPKGRQVLIQFEDARALFSNSPHLGRYVRNLALCLTPAQDYAAVESVLHALHNLHFLSILANGPIFDLREMPVGMASLLRGLIVTPTLRSLALTRIVGVPSSLILHAAWALDNVMLYRSSARDEAGSATPSFIPALRGSDPSRLQELSIVEIRENPWTSVLDLDLHQYLRGLRDLSLSVSPPVVNWSRLLQKSDAATTLQRFELTFQSSLPVVDLPLFPALRSLKFQFDIPRLTLPLNLSHLLDSLPATAPLLESLSIGTELRSVVRTVWYGDLEPYAPFASVDFVKRLPRLQKLKLSRTSFPFEDRFEEYVGHKFPGPREAGILTIDSTGYYGRCG